VLTFASVMRCAFSSSPTYDMCAAPEPALLLLRPGAPRLMLRSAAAASTPAALGRCDALLAVLGAEVV